MIQLTVKGQNISSIIDEIKIHRRIRYLQTWKVQGNTDQVSILILESYSFRVAHDLTITIIFEFKKTSLEGEVSVTIVASGGRAGLWLQASRERGILKRIKELSRTRGWSIILEGETRRRYRRKSRGFGIRRRKNPRLFK